MYENLSKIGKDEKWLQKQIVKFKTTPENVLIATMDGKGNFFCQNKSEKRRKRKMRREAVITIVIILVIIIGEWLTQSYSKKTLGGVQDSLRELKEEILSSEIEVSELIKKTNQIYDKWEEDNELLSYYLEHDELEKVNTQIVLVRGFLESDTPEDSIPEIEEGIYILEHIKEKEKLSIKNVF